MNARIPTPFSVRDSIACARQTLSQPPSIPRIVRPEFRGRVIHEFALPLDLVVPQNRKQNAPAWQRAATRRQLLTMMAGQCGGPAEIPLSSRPQVLCVRFSSREPDPYCDGFKQAIDCLCPSRSRKGKRGMKRVMGLGIIRDDRPELAEVVQWWEPAGAGCGFGYVQVRSGE